VAATSAAIATPLGRDGVVVAVMVASLPVTALRSPYVIVLERRLHYGAIATADVAEAIAYYGWALATVALGLGVWGLASAVVVRAVAGSATLVAVGTLGVVRPRWDLARVRPLMGFGVKFQLNALLYIVREYGVNVVVALVAGLSTVGVWNLAWRVLQVPNLMFMTIGRVAFPAVSRLIGAGHEPRPAIERGAGTLAALTALVTAALVGFAPALPSIVGASWNGVPSVLLWSGVALLAGAPVVFATSGYLLAADDVGRVALATGASTVTWFAMTAVLLARYGAAAVGVGWAASMVVIAAVLWQRASARSGARIAARVLAPTAVGLTGLATGWLVAHQVEPRLAGGFLGAAAGELVVVAGQDRVHDGAAVAATVVACALAAARGARILRVHDAGPARQVAALLAAVADAGDA
jgi:O-antigen/teichoic acid export membrane protein